MARSISKTTQRSYFKDFANRRRAGKPNLAMRPKAPVVQTSVAPKVTPKPMTSIGRAMTTYGVVDKIIKKANK